jgi:hypothetical protein
VVRAALTIAALLTATALQGTTAYASAAQQVGAVSIAAADSTPREASAGEGITAAFVASNHSNAAVAGVVSVTLPSGWRLLSRHGELRIAPQGRAVLVVSIAVPRAAAAGPYALVVRFSGADGKNPEATLAIRVRARREVEVALLEAPGFVPAGERYTATYIVSNRGNASQRVRMRATNAAGFRVDVQPQELELQPGESRQIRTVVLTPASLPSLLANNVTVTAESADGVPLDTTVKRSASSLVDVIPIAAERGASGLTLPIAVTVKDVEAFGGGTSGLPNQREQAVEVTGFGALNASGDTRFDLHVNTRRTASFLAEDREEYRLTLTNPLYDVWLGDQVYALTPLVAPGRYAFGGGGRATLGRITAGGFMNRNRFVRDGGDQRAGFAALRLWDLSEVSVNHVVASGNALGSVPDGELAGSSISSAAARLSLPLRSNMYVEYALGEHGGTSGRAWTGQFITTASWLSFEARHTVTDTTFPGAYGPGLDESYVRAALTPWRSLWIRATEYDRVSAPFVQLFDTLIFQDRRRYAMQVAGMGYGAFGVEYEGMRTARGTSGADEGSQTLTRLRAGTMLGRLFLSGKFENGSSRLRPTDDPQHFSRVAAASGLSLGRNSLSVTAERLTGLTIYSGPVRQRLQAGINALLRFGSGTDVRIAAYGYQFIAADTQTFASFDGTLTQRLLYDHSLVARLRRSSSGTLVPIRNIVELGYRIPFGVPVPRSSTTGSVLARVYDARTNEPLRGALVRLGDRVLLTDGAGQALFLGVRDGETQVLQLDRRGTSASMIPAAGHSLQTRGKAGRRITVDIPLAPGGRVIGRVRRYDVAGFGQRDQDNAPRLVESDSIPPLVIALSSGDQERRRSVDQHGRFEFADVAPGPLTLRVVGGDLPEQHVLSDSAVRLSIAGGDTARVELRILPRQRTLRVVGSGSVGESPGGTSVGAQRPSATAPPPRVSATVAVQPVKTPATGAPVPPALSLPRPLAVPRVADTTMAARPAPPRPQHWYVVSSTDRSVRDAAFRVYNDVALWPKIWLANRASVPDPDRLDGVRWLLIPEPAPLTAEERNALAGYLRRRVSR